MTATVATTAAAAMAAAAATATGTNTASVDTAVPFLVEPDELYIDYLEHLVKIKDQIIKKLSQDYLEDLVKVKDRMLKDQKKIIEQLSQDNETLIKENSDLYEDFELLTS
ncbi:hypothetical protein F8M41_002220 [Gigaspora margarita]|uniref:Uncharacterized protein n=1 Tax=Gigaspora margarita TaxID=4874 RepID=A0A8H3XFL7_GIGMA|nr:hypothetical protein F8M41_002220 [Gigaspora margarita]